MPGISRMFTAIVVLIRYLFYKTLGINLTLGAVIKDPMIFDWPDRSPVTTFQKLALNV